MTSLLLIFDQLISPRSVTCKATTPTRQSVELLPLTSNWATIDEVRHRFIEHLGRDEQVELLDASELVDAEVDGLRATLPEWVGRLGRLEIEGRSLRSWFLLKGDPISTWWFSAVAEKNTFKRDAFLHLAQLAAVERRLASGRYEAAAVVLCDRTLSAAIVAIGRRLGVPTRAVHPPPLANAGVKPLRRLRGALSRVRLGQAALAVAGFAHVCVRIARARRISRARPASSVPAHPAIFVTYYPALDVEEARAGRFRNTMAGPLQDLVEHRFPDLQWVCLWGPYEGRSYIDGINLALGLVRRGVPLYLLEEFVSLRGLLRAFWRWLRQAARYAWLRSRLARVLPLAPVAPVEGAPIVLQLLDESFCGWTGLAGLVFLEEFKAMFARWPRASHCLYYLELHGWEKALNAARRSLAPEVCTIGFQHTHVAPNLFNYSCAAVDLEPLAGPDACPMPDIVACNGDAGVRRLTVEKLTNVRKVEAVRQLYMLDLFAEASLGSKRDVVLLAGSISYSETRGLVSFLHASLKDTDIKVWLKGHPSQPIEPILDELQLRTWMRADVRREPIRELLKLVRAVVVGSSSVSMEAIAAGCDVFAPVLSDCMFVSPLRGLEKHYHRVTKPGDLRAELEKCLGGAAKSPARGKAFISGFWCLDPSLVRWKRLLSEP